MSIRRKEYIMVSLGCILVLVSIFAAGCTGTDSSVDPTPLPTVTPTPTPVSVDMLVGVWVEKTNDVYQIYTIRPDGTGESSLFSKTDSQLIPVSITWRLMETGKYMVGNDIVTLSDSNNGQISHQSAGVGKISKESSNPDDFDTVLNSLSLSIDDKSNEKMERAISFARGLLNYEPYSREGMLKVMNANNVEYAIYGVDNAGINWNEQAIKAAKKLQERGTTTYDSLYLKLTADLGFTDDQATYALQQIVL